MTFETPEQILEVIRTRPNEDLIMRHRDIYKHQLLHFTGIGLQESLNRIQGIENQAAVSLRQAIAKADTKPIMSVTANPLNNVFSANGWSRRYEFTNDNDMASFIGDLSDVGNGLSITQWMSTIWKDKVNIDSGGLVMLEVDEEGEVKVTYKAITDIYDYEYDGITQIEYIIFEPILNKDGDREFRVVDDSYDYIVVEKGEKLTIDEDRSYENYFGVVPASVISSRKDDKSRGQRTWVDEAMSEADHYLMESTVFSIYKLKQGIPYVWEYERACPRCAGSGLEPDPENAGESCRRCGGTGQANDRDVADKIILVKPQGDETQITPPAGYVQPDTKTHDQFRSSLQDYKENIYDAVWGQGAYVEKFKKAEKTAFEISTTQDAQRHKLFHISDNAETIERFLTDLVGRYYYPNTYVESFIFYGRDYDVKSVDEKYREYVKTIEEGVDIVVSNDKYLQYINSAYQHDPVKLEEMRLKMLTKPFFHYKTETLSKLKPGEEEYYGNLYYEQFLSDYEDQGKSLIESSEQEIKTALKAWVQENVISQTKLQ